MDLQRVTFIVYLCCFWSKFPVPVDHCALLGVLRPEIYSRVLNMICDHGQAWRSPLQETHMNKRSLFLFLCSKFLATISLILFETFKGIKSIDLSNKLRICQEYTKVQAIKVTSIIDIRKGILIKQNPSGKCGSIFSSAFHFLPISWTGMRVVKQTFITKFNRRAAII